MPVILFLHVLTGMWAVTFFIKIPLVFGVTAIICLVSYHYLVRSTLLGVLLNGRKHAFQANMWKAMTTDEGAKTV